MPGSHRTVPHRERVIKWTAATSRARLRAQSFCESGLLANPLSCSLKGRLLIKHTSQGWVLPCLKTLEGGRCLQSASTSQRGAFVKLGASWQLPRGHLLMTWLWRPGGLDPWTVPERVPGSRPPWGTAWALDRISPPGFLSWGLSTHLEAAW